MLADIHTLYDSGFCRITDYHCFCDTCSVSDPEYNDSFSMSFIRKGFFGYKTFRRNDEVHAGRVLLSKPGYEHIIHHIEGQPDITSIFEFTTPFFTEIKERYRQQAGWFFYNNDMHSVLLASNPSAEYIHHLLLKRIGTNNISRLEIDELVIALIEKVLGLLNKDQQPEVIPAALKKYHLVTSEMARGYILANFHNNISLQQLAEHTCVSVFHFSRIFKTVFNSSPHQYLNAVRLHHAAVLLHTTQLPVTDIAHDCGFNSAEHFATAFRHHFKKSPSGYRNQAV